MFVRQNVRLSTKLSNNDDDSEQQQSNGVSVEESKPEIAEPPMYQVVLVNDDFTPMEYVIEVLEKFFSKDRIQATNIMLQIHHQGKGVCGLYRNEIAEMKVEQVNDDARSNNHPLLAVMEKT